MKVAAVFATMNRSAVALSCVKSLSLQHFPLAYVVIADNGSADNTINDLKSLSSLPFPLEVLELGCNIGNAGGIAAAMEQAFGNGADAVWILDDDSWPRPDALSAILSREWDRMSVLHAHQVNPQTVKGSPISVSGQAGKRISGSQPFFS